MTGGHNDRHTNMTGTNTTDEETDTAARTGPGGDTDPTTDTEHHLGGVAAGVAGVEVLTVPESPGRFTVETLPADAHPTDGDAPPAVVDVGLQSDGVAVRTLLDPAQARALADRLATAADTVERRRGDE
jgi:hypothetical protein